MNPTLPRLSHNKMQLTQLHQLTNLGTQSSNSPFGRCRDLRGGGFQLISSLATTPDVTALLNCNKKSETTSAFLDGQCRTTGQMTGLSGLNRLEQLHRQLQNQQHRMMRRNTLDATISHLLVGSNGIIRSGLDSLGTGVLICTSGRSKRGGVIEPFPEKLHRLLLEVEAAGRSDVVSFIGDGFAFAIHKPDIFFKEIIPLYFRQSRLSSFKRQLNLYGFKLIGMGPAMGGYHHKNFRRDKPELCQSMRRIINQRQQVTEIEKNKNKNGSSHNKNKS